LRVASLLPSREGAFSGGDATRKRPRRGIDVNTACSRFGLGRVGVGHRSFSPCSDASCGLCCSMSVHVGAHVVGMSNNKVEICSSTYFSGGYAHCRPVVIDPLRQASMGKLKYVCRRSMRALSISVSIYSPISTHTSFSGPALARALVATTITVGIKKRAHAHPH
jgi:hypothetical protein